MCRPTIEAFVVPVILFVLYSFARTIPDISSRGMLLGPRLAYCSSLSHKSQIYHHIMLTLILALIHSAFVFNKFKLYESDAFEVSLSGLNLVSPT